MKNENAYLKPVTLRNILKFAVPTVAMTVFMSCHGRQCGDYEKNGGGQN